MARWCFTTVKGEWRLEVGTGLALASGQMMFASLMRYLLEDDGIFRGRWLRRGNISTCVQETVTVLTSYN
ncbi:predicted protein [Plenodomus lingam JN3]|uniref:Predicted protein n=1 Tax=Leptosphaeria maculans (strain JN3 / isolate v23.1.3 / race Av1-4-5-6-7-8) TaxID=985895 RepID=E4ZUN9_LEPMJ|nr:predicted protein [Plenodomus lingam JN3]CBX95118.1 predicted protein [Plenodomus lingam JN3]